MHRSALSLSAALIACSAGAAAKETQRVEPSRVAVASSVIRDYAATQLAVEEAGHRAAADAAEVVLAVAEATPLEGGDETRDALSLPEQSDASEPSAAPGFGYRSLLGALFIARDLQIPGAEGMGLRLIPTRTALSGESAPVVLRPRLVGSGWVGMDVAARF